MSALDVLNIEQRFKVWAAQLGYDLTTDSSGYYTNAETRSASLGFQAAHGAAGCKPSGQQLYGKIKKSSDYAHQSDDLFPIHVGTPPNGNFAVRGGPGGVYPLRDIEFYVIDDGKQYRLK
ncbi:hypothetical protein [Pseudomonas huaxiensis]|uniref:hypothetical protein n=1 Tax=Pseudomonas huaxiensis TaxID=2213017 RepID=UPI000DA6AC46|nr:hypothetical protein [Pseudomonas huaxiensis]